MTGFTPDRLAEITGALLAIAGRMVSAETFYPGCDATAGDQIIILGATRPPDSVLHQPSAAILDATMRATGPPVAGAVLLYRAGFVRTSLIPLGLFGPGAFLVGVFPGNRVAIHALSSLLAFVAGGVAAVAIVRVPFRITAPTLGVSSLLTLLPYFLGDASPMLAFGEGGIERRVAYPVLLSGPGFGSYLVGGARAVGADPRRLTARS